jgi:hypothetical protein
MIVCGSSLINKVAGLSRDTTPCRLPRTERAPVQHTAVDATDGTYFNRNAAQQVVYCEGTLLVAYS